jgi:UDP-3-O-[3-hydroxymyristoyl] glucosamine N-acyltransferase
VILYGAGPFLLRVYETALATSEKPVAYCTEPIEPSPELPIPHLETYQPEILPEVPVFLAFLDNTVRRNLFRRIRHPLAKALIHPSAEVAPSVSVGAGSFIGPGVRIEAGATVGPLVIIEEGAVIQAGAIIEEGAFVGSFSRVAAGTRVGAYAYVGAGTILTPDPPPSSLLIGEGTIIGAHMEVRKSCLPFSWVLPGRSWPPE